MTYTIVDADGHVMEDSSLATHLQVNEEFLSTTHRLTRPLWPSLDSHHTGIFIRSKQAFGDGRKVGAAEWTEFLDDTGIRYSALYPSHGLSMGNIITPYWAEIVARAYNDWLYETHVSRNPRLKGIALLPMQDPAAAVAELRRVVKELGFIGAMLPAVGLTRHLGDKMYWPVYEEAQRLDVMLGVHGGNHSKMGFDDFTSYIPKNGLGHPVGQLIALSSFVFHGVLDEFPTLRIAFLEAGSAWVGLWVDRMDRSYQYHVDLAVGGKPIVLKEKLPSDYFRSGRVFVGCEGSERSLPTQIKLVGNAAVRLCVRLPARGERSRLPPRDRGDRRVG